MDEHFRPRLAPDGDERGGLADERPAGVGVRSGSDAARPAHPLLSFEEVTKLYGQLRAVDRLSFQADAGELLALVGPNGSGKSTLLRLAAGLLLPTTGRILVAGAEAGSPAAAARLCYVPDRAVGAPDLSARTNLRLFARRHIGRSEADGVLRAVRLSKVAGRATTTFSLGMRQRLMLGALLVAEDEHGLPRHRDGNATQPLSTAETAAVAPGRVFLLDEPTSALDPDGREWLWDLLHQRVASGGTVVVATHDLTDALAHASRVLRVRDGTLESVEPAPLGPG